MHSASPSFVLNLCNKLYDYSPETFLIHIKGYEFQLQEGLSEKAQNNLESALAFVKNLLSAPEELIENLGARLLKL